VEERMRRGTGEKMALMTVARGELSFTFLRNSCTVIVTSPSDPPGNFNAVTDFGSTNLDRKKQRR